jgi:hypothetical protein
MAARALTSRRSKAAGVPQEAPRLLFHVREPISVETKSGSLLVLLPDDEFRISCTQAGPENRFTQFMSTAITPAIYERENRARPHLRLLRRCRGVDGEKPDQRRQPGKCDRR